MPTEKETLYIAFSTQKGGAGKTTLTVLAASYLHYVKGLNVAVVDCDYPQHSIAEMRKRDLKTVMEDEHYKAMAYRQLQRIGKKAYPVIEGTAEDAVEKAEGLLEKLPGTDIVFFDLPGTVNSGGGAADAGEHGLHFLAHRGRPGGDGKHPALCGQAEGHANGHGQDEHQGAVPAVEHGGRAREVGTLQGI